MVARIGDAIAAYAKTGQIDSGPSGGSAVAPGKDFASFLRDSVQEAHEVMKGGEQMSMKAITGKADLNDVIVAVNDAEVTLQTVVGLRDRMVQAYQEILRMPI
ncbi:MULTISPECIES: flagellar hook-basal body complex protein FliE [Oceanibaculum]|uniref:Flagellar hook-basal body complex protein FliE n=2 Tax=Oceanibaculum indicum TaxID=526216 RepID=K2KCJ7_9PROT|nr:MULTISPECIES: flagellar hook-basal body complex protein FliE [Oceanibaculum]EKE75030.1 flagellar hook-basal body complex protein FliE [Oceanibaculum indicum P24]MCH2394930.1 flagellar hook-basal body complex protein FliE [Oceanibaculum sp.]RKQ72706.1 flagellar hook-basal body complex protein FliE [Oceanibaculum indicum]